MFLVLSLVQNLPTLPTDFVPSGPLPRVCTAVFPAPPWWFADATATPLAALFRTVRGTVAYLGPIGMCLGACGPGKRLIVDRYLPSHITHFFVFSMRRTNSGCGAGEHKHQHQRRPRSRTIRFDGHTWWFSGWPEPNGQRELQWWAQKLVSESAISQNLKHVLRKPSTAHQDNIGPRTHASNASFKCKVRDVWPQPVEDATVGGAKGVGSTTCKIVACCAHLGRTFRRTVR